MHRSCWRLPSLLCPIWLALRPAGLPLARSVPQRQLRLVRVPPLGSVPPPVLPLGQERGQERGLPPERVLPRARMQARRLARGPVPELLPVRALPRVRMRARRLPQVLLPAPERVQVQVQVQVQAREPP